MTLPSPRLGGAILLFALAHPLLARGEGPIVNDAPRPHLAIPQAGTTLPLVTADANDPAWNHSATVELDTPSLGSNLPPGTALPKTSVRALWTPAWLYFRFLCADDHPPYLPAHVAGASLHLGDVVELFLDPAGDCRQWCELQFNPAGERFMQNTVAAGEPQWDASLHLTGDYIARDTWSFQDSSLQAVRNAAAPWRRDGKIVGWIVDIALPAATILKHTGRRTFGPMTLRGDLLRYEYSAQPGAARREFISLTWSPILLGTPHRCPAAFGYFDLTHPEP